MLGGIFQKYEEKKNINFPLLEGSSGMHDDQSFYLVCMGCGSNSILFSFVRIHVVFLCRVLL